MWNIFLMGSHDSIPSSPGTGGRLLPPCTKSVQSGKETFPGTRLTLPATGADTRSAARAVRGGVCRNCCEVYLNRYSYENRTIQILCGDCYLYPSVTMNAPAPDRAPSQRISDKNSKKKNPCLPYLGVALNRRPSHIIRSSWFRS